MPGPVSDSYDPEWGTGETRSLIHQELTARYRQVSTILSDAPPIDIRTLCREPNRRTTPHQATLTEHEWRIIRFALERAMESL